MGSKSYIAQHKKQRSSQYISHHKLNATPNLSFLPSIVAVHGLNGDRTRTWTTESGNLCWLKHPDFLPKYIKRARVLSWGYNANISSFTGKTTSSDRILQHAQTLIAQLQADRDVSTLTFTANSFNVPLNDCTTAPYMYMSVNCTQLEDANNRPIIFLCHSLGGIIVKRVCIDFKSFSNLAIC